MKGCEEYQEMISSMLDGELSQAEKHELRAHLESCPRCRAMYSAFSSLSENFGEESPFPDGLHDRIMSGVKAAGRKQKRKGLLIKLRPYMSAAIAACFVLIAVSAFSIGRDSGLSMTSSDAKADTAGLETLMETAPQTKAAADAFPAEAGGTGSVPSPEPVPKPDEDFGSAEENTSLTETASAPTERPAGEIRLDVKESLVSTTAGGSTTSEQLNGVDSVIWINSLINGNYSYAGNIPKSDISFRIDVTPEDGSSYTLFFAYDEAGQLTGSRSENMEDCISVESLEDFVRLSEDDGE